MRAFRIGLLAGFLAVAGCAAGPDPVTHAWPPAAHPEWKHLDPELCHPWPCHAGDPVEWLGADNLPSGP